MPGEGASLGSNDDGRALGQLLAQRERAPVDNQNVNASVNSPSQYTARTRTLLSKPARSNAASLGMVGGRLSTGRSSDIPEVQPARLLSGPLGRPSRGYRRNMSDRDQPAIASNASSLPPARSHRSA